MCKERCAKKDVKRKMCKETCATKDEQINENIYEKEKDTKG